MQAARTLRNFLPATSTSLSRLDYPASSEHRRETKRREQAYCDCPSVSIVGDRLIFPIPRALRRRTCISGLVSPAQLYKHDFSSGGLHSNRSVRHRRGGAAREFSQALNYTHRTCAALFDADAGVEAKDTRLLHRRKSRNKLRYPEKQEEVNSCPRIV